MDTMHKGLDVSIYAKPELFPAPCEVDRYLYIVFYNYTYELDILFPAPTEVGRYLYDKGETFEQAMSYPAFPAPREVDRFLYSVHGRIFCRRK